MRRHGRRLCLRASFWRMLFLSPLRTYVTLCRKRASFGIPAFPGVCMRLRAILCNGVAATPRQLAGEVRSRKKIRRRRKKLTRPAGLGRATPSSVQGMSPRRGSPVELEQKSLPLDGLSRPCARLPCSISRIWKPVITHLGGDVGLDANFSEKKYRHFGSKTCRKIKSRQGWRRRIRK